MCKKLLFLAFVAIVFAACQTGRPATAAIDPSQSYAVACLGFYNVENLFDTIDQAEVRDEEFTPSGTRLWNGARYAEKQANMARVIAEVGTELAPEGLSLFGVAEVENRGVLEDLVRQPALAARNYQIIHHDSPDQRGIDVALIYNPKYFKPEGHKSEALIIYDDEGERVYTRDVLLVTGRLVGERIHVLVNHWPSRSGGEKASEPRRMAAAQLNRHLVDSILQVEPAAKIFITGDLNDDPVNTSVKGILKARKTPEEATNGNLFNTSYADYSQGNGTLAYRDAWNLFDQIIISPAWLDTAQEGFFFYKSNIYKKPYMIQHEGQYKGYPLRTFSGDTYVHGFSDHFPVYAFFLKRR